MRLNANPRVDTQDLSLQRELREHATQVNLLSEGRLSSNYAAVNQAPTTGDYAVGDFVRNNNPVEFGVTSSRYVIFGWLCITAGSPGVFVPCRFLTGN